MSDQTLHTNDTPCTPAPPMTLPAAMSWTDHAAAQRSSDLQHEVERVRVDEQLRGIATRRAALDVEEAELLRYAEELKLWRAFGFGSMLEYMERALGYAPHTAAERLRVSRALADLPLIADALAKGDLAHSAARELSRVATPDSKGIWLGAASGKNLREIEALVSGHRAGDLPTDKTEPRLRRKTITLELSPESYDIWRQLHALAAEEHGQRLSDDELIPTVFRRAYASGDKIGSPAYKTSIKRCPDCRRTWQFSGGRDIEIDPAVAECAECDAIHLGSLDASAPARTTTTVTARKREQVLARDGNCCIVPGCRRNVGLDLHHIKYQSCGGGHDLSNVITICELHHKAVHFGKLVIRGTAPDHLTFEFRRPRNRRNVIDDDGPSTPEGIRIDPSNRVNVECVAEVKTAGPRTATTRTAEPGASHRGTGATSTSTIASAATGTPLRARLDPVADQTPRPPTLINVPRESLTASSIGNGGGGRGRRGRDSAGISTTGPIQNQEPP